MQNKAQNSAKVKDLYEKYWSNILNIVNMIDPANQSLDDVWAFINYCEITNNFSNFSYTTPDYDATMKCGPPPSFSSSLRDYCIDKKKLIIEPGLEESSIIVDLGSGWGRNSIFLSQMYPDKQIISLEYCTAGSQANQILCEKYDITNILATDFDYHNYDAIMDVVYPRVTNSDSIYYFSSWSIEQIPYLEKGFIQALVDTPCAAVTTLHIEPIGWQIKNIKKNTNLRYNNNLYPLLQEFSDNEIIKIVKTEADVYGSNAKGSKILWVR